MYCILGCEHYLGSLSLSPNTCIWDSNRTYTISLCGCQSSYSVLSLQLGACIWRYPSVLSVSVMRTIAREKRTTSWEFNRYILFSQKSHCLDIKNDLLFPSSSHLPYKSEKQSSRMVNIYGSEVRTPGLESHLLDYHQGPIVSFLLSKRSIGISTSQGFWKG